MRYSVTNVSLWSGPIVSRVLYPFVATLRTSSSSSSGATVASHHPPRHPPSPHLSWLLTLNCQQRILSSQNLFLSRRRSETTHVQTPRLRTPGGAGVGAYCRRNETHLMMTLTSRRKVLKHPVRFVSMPRFIVALRRHYQYASPILCYLILHRFIYIIHPSFHWQRC